MSAANRIDSGLTDMIATWVPVVRRLLHDDDGQDLIEYALVFTFVALGAIASLKSVTAGVVAVFTAVGTALTNAV